MDIYQAVYRRRLNPRLRIVSRLTRERNLEAVHGKPQAVESSFRRATSGRAIGRAWRKVGDSDQQPRIAICAGAPATRDSQHTRGRQVLCSHFASCARRAS